MTYQLPDLPYALDALEPVIDAKTMEIHHGKHHAAYVSKANAALEGTKWADLPVADVLKVLDELPDDKRGPVRNNAGGHANHSLFWTIMAPKGKGGGGAPSGDLASAIDDACGSFDAFKKQFADAAANRFGSGWAWLSVAKNGLVVESTPNQDSPISHGNTPILGLDVWEHAYYLTYQNRRPDYISAWWDVVNWGQVLDNFRAARG